MLFSTDFEQSSQVSTSEFDAVEGSAKPQSLGYLLPFAPMLVVVGGYLLEASATVWLCFAIALVLARWLLRPARECAIPRLPGPSVMETVSDLVPWYKLVGLMTSGLLGCGILLWWIRDSVTALGIFAVTVAVFLGLSLPDGGSKQASIGNRFLTTALELAPRVGVFATVWFFYWSLLQLHASSSLTVRLWVVGGVALSCSNAIGLAHVLIHRPANGGRMLGRFIASFLGYPHYVEEHLMNHCGGRMSPGRTTIAASMNESIYSYMRRRLPQSIAEAQEWIALRRTARPGNLYVFLHPIGLLVMGITAAASWFLASWWGLAMYTSTVVLTYWTITADSYLRHWGLAGYQLNAGSSATWTWEMSPQWAGMLSLDLASGTAHYRAPNLPYYAYRPSANAPTYPLVSVTMRIIVLFPRAYRKLAYPRVLRWRESLRSRGSKIREDRALQLLHVRRARLIREHTASGWGAPISGYGALQLKQTTVGLRTGRIEKGAAVGGAVNTREGYQDTVT